MPRKPSLDGLCQCGCGERTSLARSSVASRGVVKGQPYRFVAGHQSRKSPVAYIVADDTGCWVWQRALGKDGYGHIRRGGRTQYAHRYYYEQHVGPIPDGFELDHLCRNRACVNPAHLEPVSHTENIRRGRHVALKTHCKNGHPWIAENIVPHAGATTCRICRDISQRRATLAYRQRQAA